ncbi:MAG TPA: GTPase HflX, partial [Leptospiraceae bacterium]|nr:GTPase HflX [Leptospiraceae bacterium]
TLEELGDADILLHVVDISNPNYEAQIESVENILESLDLKEVKTIRVYNKADAVDPERMIPDDGIAVSAVMKTGFENLLREIEYGVWSL